MNRRPTAPFFSRPPPQGVLDPGSNFVFHSPSPHQHFSQCPAFPPTTGCDLPTTLSYLKSLIASSEQTLESLSKTLHCCDGSLNGMDRNGDVISCPFNPHHQMPPESLFRHYLRCPPPIDATNLLEDLNYPHITGWSSDFKRKCEALQPGGEIQSADITLSLGSYVEIGSNFFYKNCPGVVTFSDLERLKKTVTIPAVLSQECTDDVCFVRNRMENVALGKDFKVLPSDYCAIKKEVDAWGDFPSSYSFAILCSLIGSKELHYGGLKRWIIAQSPRYGVILDSHMRDQIFLLFRLCLKAILKEAFSHADAIHYNRDTGRNNDSFGLKDQKFNCFVLVQALAWLTSQLLVLYGEIHGKFFGLNLLKKFVLESTGRLMLFQSEDKTLENTKLIEPAKKINIQVVTVSDIKLEEPPKSTSSCKVNESDGDGNGPILVSHVAAAILALNERSILEEKLRALKFGPPSKPSQRLAEHDSLTIKADAERNACSNYRPIVEYDSNPQRKLTIQETNKVKTREEILAEERDYKRRRMSYRGKKVKRTPLQVMRDLITQYTEEIGLAWETEEGSKEKSMLPPKSVTIQDDKIKQQGGNNISVAAEPTQTKMHHRSSGCHQRHRGDSVTRSTSVDREKMESDFCSGNARKHGYEGRLYGHGYHCTRHDNDESRRSKHHSSGRQSSSHSVRNIQLDTGERHHRKKYHQSSSRKVYEDRYDPSE